MKAFSVRLATSADSLSAVQVVKEVYEEYGFTWDPEDYHADLYDLGLHYLDKGFPFWIAELEGEPVGTIALESFDPVPGTVGDLTKFEGELRVAGTDCAIQRLYVRPKARNLGVGGSLFEFARTEALRRRKTAMEIWSDKRFESAHRLYLKHGATIVGERICDDPDESPEWGLHLALPSEP